MYHRAKFTDEMGKGKCVFVFIHKKVKILSDKMTNGKFGYIC